MVKELDSNAKIQNRIIWRFNFKARYNTKKPNNRYKILKKIRSNRRYKTK